MKSIAEKIGGNKDLRAIFEKNGVLFAYLFGSQLGEYADKTSDIDIAIMLPIKISKEERFELRLKLAGEISKVLKKEADVIILNDTKSLFFKYVIVKEGKLIYEKSELKSAEFESLTLGLYFDFRPFLEEYDKFYVQRNLQ
jgi:predicted nucleotidyltransferase